jgi:putative ABC transport system permease protein
MESLWQDLRHAARALARSPGFTLAAAATLALAIGGNAVLFSVVNVALLGWDRTFEDPGRLVLVWQKKGDDRWAPTPADFRDWREDTRTFAGMGAYHYEDASLSTAGGPERVALARITASVFPVLGVRPARGRGFRPEEESWGAHRVVLLSHALWTKAFGGDPGVVGREVRLDGEVHTVVGVMPPGAWPAARRVDAWAPMAFAPKDPRNDRHSHFVFVVARLRPGQTLAEADAAMGGIARRLERLYPENDGLGAGVDPLRDMTVGRTQAPLLALLGAVAFVLLIACANVANLQLARAARREREMALRRALGAGRGRLARSLLTESALLAVLGGLLGFALALWGVELAARLVPASIPRLAETGVPVDLRVLGFTLAVTLGTGILFGTVPALSAAGVDVMDALREGSRSAAGGVRSRGVRELLVVGEISLAVVLLAGAGLLVASFRRLRNVDPGFDPAPLLTLRIEPPPSEPGVRPDPAAAFFEDLLARVSRLPGVAAAGVTTHRPLGGGGEARHFTIDGRPAPASLGEVPNVVARQESASSLQAMGVPLRRGRYFAETDDASAPRVAIINEALVRRFFPEADPLGATIMIDPPEHLWPVKDLPPGGRFARWTVVGVVGDVRYVGPRQAAEEVVYVPYRQRSTTLPWTPSYLVVRAYADPTALVAPVRREVRALDKNQPVSEVMTGGDLLRASLGAERLGLDLVGAFACLALLLATLGVYGVVSYSVAQRAHELGIRAALGATAGDLARLAVGEGLRLTVVGLGLGLGGGLALTRLLESLLFGVTARDALAYLAAAVLLALIALGACYLPARRAARADPMAALRRE